MHASILRYFIEIAREGSIRKASDKVHVATSALSRQIRKLEDELGVKLFERQSDGLRLTPAGEIVLRHAKDTVQNFDLMRSDLGELGGRRTGRVKIACLDSLVVHFMPAFIRRFHARNPAVDFRIRADNFITIFEGVAEGSADIGITFDLACPHDLKLVCGVRMPLMIMVARHHPLAKLAKATLQECAQFNLLLQLDNEVVSSTIAVELAALDRVGRSFVATNNQMMLKPLILSGEGVAFFTPLGLLPELTSGEIVAVSIAGSRLKDLQVGIVTPRFRPLTRAAEAVVEALADDLRRFANKVSEVIGQ